MEKKVEYEFTEEENLVFTSLSRNMIILAIVIFTGGVATILQFALGDLRVLLIIDGILYCIMALTFYFPTDNFKRIVTTEGKDIPELMTAFNELDKGWLIVNLVTLVSRIVAFIMMLTIIMAVMP